MWLIDQEICVIAVPTLASLISQLNDELIKLQDILSQEQKIREESENSLIKVG